MDTLILSEQARHCVVSNNTGARLGKDTLDDCVTDDLADIDLLETTNCSNLCKR